MGEELDRLLMMLNLLLSTALAAPPDLSGDWEVVISVVSAAKIPVFGNTQITTKTTLLAHIDGLTQQHTTCAVVPSSPLRMITTTIPDSFVRHIPAKTYPITVSESGHYRADFGPQHIAYDPSKTDGQPPSEADHESVYDWDNDGNPGATILLDTRVLGQAEVYIVQLAHTRLSGQVSSSDSFSGSLEILVMEQQSIGAKPLIFATNPELTPLSSASSFTMRRLPEGTTCAEL